MYNRSLAITYTALFVGLMIIGANISVWFPFLAVPIGGQSVPLSLQPFFAILAGLILGKRLGFTAMVVYLLLGITGLPIFANLKGGIFPFLGPTGGFLISFLLMAFCSGWLAEKFAYRRSGIFLAALTGFALNYLIGVSYMYAAMNTLMEAAVSYKAAWLSMVPFAVKDLAFTVLAALFYLRIANLLPMTKRNRSAV